MKICMIFVPLFSQDNPVEWIGRPKSEIFIFQFSQDNPVEWIGRPTSEIFIFQKVKPTWSQPDLSSVYVAACLLHLRS